MAGSKKKRSKGMPEGKAQAAEPTRGTHGTLTVELMLGLAAPGRTGHLRFDGHELSVSLHGVHGGCLLLPTFIDLHCFELHSVFEFRILLRCTIAHAVVCLALHLRGRSAARADRKQSALRCGCDRAHALLTCCNRDFCATNCHVVVRTKVAAASKAGRLRSNHDHRALLARTCSAPGFVTRASNG